MPSIAPRLPGQTPSSTAVTSSAPSSAAAKSKSSSSGLPELTNYPLPPLMDPARYFRGTLNASAAVMRTLTMPTEAWKAPMVAPIAFSIGFAPEMLMGAWLRNPMAGPRGW